MAFIAKDSGGGNFKKVPPGAYIGRCFSLIDLGTQFTDGQFGPKSQHKIKIGFELFGGRKYYLVQNRRAFLRRQFTQRFDDYVEFLHREFKFDGLLLYRSKREQRNGCECG
jgi:hypothetical protein